MRHTIWVLLLVITVGVLGFAAGRNTQTTSGSQVYNFVETGQTRVVLAKSGTRHQSDPRQQNEGCPVIPNDDLSQQKTNERDNSMKGLIF